jgi:hypothetical protein
MITLDRGHLASTHRAAVQLDEKLRAWDQDASWCSSVGSAADLVQMLRTHGDYWDRVREGRLRTVKRLLARVGQPFFKSQIRYNLLVAECLGRIEVSLGELREAVQASRGTDDEPKSTAN